MGPLLLIAYASLAAAPAGATTPSLPTISIDMAALDRSTFEALEQAGIYQGLVVRLVTERIALVDPKVRADMVLRIESAGEPGELRITASGVSGSRQQQVSVRHLEQEAVRLQIIHVAIELVRQVQALQPPAPAPGPGARLQTRLELWGGGLWSSGTPGIMTRLAGTLPLGPGEAGLGLVLHRPLISSPDLEVTEWGLFGVVGTGECTFSSWGRLTAGLDLGLWQHRYRYSGAGGNDNGSRLDAAAILHAGASVRIATGWRAGLAAGLLWTLHERVHQSPTERLWSAPNLRPFVGLTVGFGREAGN